MFQDPGALATAVVVLLGCVIAADVFSLVAGGNLRSVFSDLFDNPYLVSDDRIDTANLLYATSAVLQITALLATSVLFIVWFHRVRLNADVFEPHNQRKSQGWAIGAWFVPVANLWIPKQIANDIWDSSAPPTTEEHPESATHGLVSAWWAVWITSLLLSQGAGELYQDANTYDANHDAVGALMAADILDITAAVLAILFVRTLSTRQRLKASGPALLPAPAARSVGESFWDTPPAATPEHPARLKE